MTKLTLQLPDPPLNGAWAVLDETIETSNGRPVSVTVRLEPRAMGSAYTKQRRFVRLADEQCYAPAASED